MYCSSKHGRKFSLRDVLLTETPFCKVVTDFELVNVGEKAKSGKMGKSTRVVIIASSLATYTRGVFTWREGGGSQLTAHKKKKRVCWERGWL